MWSSRQVPRIGFGKAQKVLATIKGKCHPKRTECTECRLGVQSICWGSPMEFRHFPTETMVEAATRLTPIWLGTVSVDTSALNLKRGGAYATLPFFPQAPALVLTGLTAHLLFPTFCLLDHSQAPSSSRSNESKLPIFLFFSRKPPFPSLRPQSTSDDSHTNLTQKRRVAIN